MIELVETIEVADSTSTVTCAPRPEDDPQVRRPQPTSAEDALGWQAQVELRGALERTIGWFRAQR
jgi:nucleoside-diphosphate-sugar epimerase